MRNYKGLLSMLVSLLLVNWIAASVWADERQHRLEQQQRWQQRPLTSTLNHYRFSTIHNPNRPPMPQDSSASLMPSLSMMGSQEQQRRWQDSTLRIRQQQTMLYIDQLHAHNLESPMVAMDPDSLMRVQALSIGRAWMTLGARSVMLGLDAMGMGGGGLISRVDIARGVVRVFEGMIDTRLNSNPGGWLITGQVGAIDRGIGNLEFEVGLGRLAMDTLDRFSSFTTTSLQLGPNTLQEPSGQLYWPINRVSRTTWSIDWPGIGRDNLRTAMGTMVNDGLAERAYRHMVMPTMGNYSGTHINGSRLTGSWGTSPRSVTHFDDFKMKITQAWSTDRAFVGGRMFGFNPTADTLRTTTIQRGWQREIVNFSNLSGLWSKGVDFGKIGDPRNNFLVNPKAIKPGNPGHYDIFKGRNFGYPSPLLKRW